MTDTNLLKAEIKKLGLTQAEVAELVGMAPQTFSNKVNNNADFTATEIAKLKALFNLDDADTVRIFFKEKVDF